ncbi:thioredoxin-like protein [Kockiozyma suomiensis]|uniref:thioredoxin-like protein n=1 Tax=Kockiozyma suomiensis TaxID=1337062 RepID=UPI0033435A01
MPPRKSKEPVDPTSLRRSGRSHSATTSPLSGLTNKAKIVKPTASDPKAEKNEKDEKDKKELKNTKLAELQVGDPIPDISIVDQDGNSVNLSTLDASTIVIFAYPKASTPGCTRQACGFRDEFPKFDERKVVVFGLSADSVSAQKNFQEKQKLPYSLLADTKYELIGPLGAKKTATGGITRSYWVVRNGKITTKVIGVKPEISVANSLKEILASS